MVIVYPAFQTLFTMVISNLLWINKPQVRDLMDEAVIFTVDFFITFYLATCMQRASSFLTIYTVVVIDLSQTAIALYSLHNRTRGILTNTRGVTDTKLLKSTACYV
ncbi:hypothetical protein PHPALM_31343 [Phytophthora palmivora]|uniref:Uncharacterized protein n=1 Tax=Phytophthora palmivora TaxID=4796 RepID=A0A2P4X2T9_9STRA|nr:hypothetical protein PHPALM_31343 [Phytophthora palmivora]